MLYSKNNQIHYTISMPEPSSHAFEVKIEFKGIKDKTLNLNLPVWRPGRYLIFEFASGIIDFKAYDSELNELKWRKTSKSQWKIETRKSKDIIIVYKVYANEFNLRTRGLDSNHAFIDGTSVFMYSAKYRFYPLTLKVIPHENWHVTTGLDSSKRNINTFTAPNYDYLADCPLEIGNQTDIEFTVKGKKHVLSISGDVRYEKEKIIKDLEKIIKCEIDFWKFIPYKKYIFIVHGNSEGGGGTEHINSSVNDIGKHTLENKSSYSIFLRLISHEFFHTWNVKYLRPKGLSPYDFTKENYTEELWIAEGGTSYYDSLIVLRAGLMPVEDFLDEIIEMVDEDRTRAGNLVQSLAESSFDAWVKYWKVTPQRNEYESDYYRRGAVVSMLLDIEIRQRTKNEYSLDDVFRSMIKKFPYGKGYRNEDFMNECNRISHSDFREFFDDYVYGTKPIDWERTLLYAGLALTKNEIDSKLDLGLRIEYKGGKILNTRVNKKSLAFNSGLRADDEIMAINGERMSFEKYVEKIDSISEGEKLKFTLFRNNKIKEITLLFRTPANLKYSLKKIENPDELQKDIFVSWTRAKN